MKALLTLFIGLTFISSQGLGAACSAFCEHHQISSEKESSHECCPTEKSNNSDEENQHECNAEMCSISYIFDSSVVVVAEQETTNNNVNSFVANVPDYSFYPDSNIKDANFIVSTDRGTSAPKVPLYLFYKKLILPSFS